MAGILTTAAATTESRAVRSAVRQRSANTITLLLAGLLAFVLLAGCAARAQTAAAEVSGSVANGFARLVFVLPDDAAPEVRMAGGIILVSFQKPVEISVDHLATAVPGYVAVARSDPDGGAVRIALSRKVSINTMLAAEKLFVDLLPEGWTGLPPGLPQEVVDELARRARQAEQKAREQRPPALEKRFAVVRVRVATLPTFTRYTFGLPETTTVVASRNRDDLTLTFDAPLKFDLLDAKGAMPEIISDVRAETADETATVRFEFAGKADVRTFREEGSFVVDVSPVGARSNRTPLTAGENGAEPDTAWLPPPDSDDQMAESASSPPAPGKAVQAGEPATPPMDKSAPPPQATAAPQPADAPQPAGVAAPAPLPATAEQSPAPEQPAIRPQPASAGERGSAPASPAKVGADTPVVALSKRQDENLRLIFPFRDRTASAVFQRADTLWLVFDTAVPLDVTRLKAEQDGAIREVALTRSGQGRVVRVTFDKARLASMAADGTSWIVTIGETVLDPTAPLKLARARSGQGHAIGIIPFAEPQQVHRIRDPEAGDGLLVITAHGPARGFLKAHDLVEFRAPASTHGVVIEPVADDLAIELTSDRIVIGRPGGLELTPAAAAEPGGRAAMTFPPIPIDVASWNFDREADFFERRSGLMHAVADAPEAKRAAARLMLGRFFLARDMFAEAKGVFDATLADERVSEEKAIAMVLRGIANLMLRREEAALKDFSGPVVGDQHAAPMWRSVALSRQGRYADARHGFGNIEAASAELPVKLQRMVFQEAARCALEVGDLARAALRLNELEAMGVPQEMRPDALLLSGRLAERLKRPDDAFAAYRTAAQSDNQPAAAHGRLRAIALRYALKDLSREEAIAELETLTAAWRGDETEVEALQILAHLYAEEGRFREAFQIMRIALTAHPRSQSTRRIQDEASATFDSVFLGGRGKALSPADALALFYDFRSLTPAGPRGDEMIRRLAERLVSMDLLAQAGELLQHQIDHRLKGAARAQVAARLAAVYLMHRKPDRALTALRATRTNDLPADLRRQRLLLEARALSDSDRHDLALEIVEDMQGHEVQRLRADIRWAARQWREAAEEIERLLGQRWRAAEPLQALERRDVLRAAIAYALAEETLGLDRFREKYSARMAEGPDARIFNVVTTPPNARPAEFAGIAKGASSLDTLEAFLHDLRERYPDPAPTAAATSGDERKS